MQWILYSLAAHAVRVVGIVAAGVLFGAVGHHMPASYALVWVALVAAGFALSESILPEAWWYRRAYAGLTVQGFLLNPDFTEALMRPLVCPMPDDRARFQAIRHEWLLTDWHRIYVWSHWALYVGFASLVAVRLGVGGSYAAVLGALSYLSGWLGLGLHRHYLRSQVVGAVLTYAEEGDVA